MTPFRRSKALGGAQFSPYQFPSSPGATFVLTNKASQEAQIASIKMLDYMFTQEGEIKGIFGVDDRTVVQPGPNDKPLEAGVTPLYKTVTRPQGVAPYNSDIGALAQYNNTKEFRAARLCRTTFIRRTATNGGCIRRPRPMRNMATKPSTSRPWGVWVDPSLGSEVATLQTNIQSYISPELASFITGSKSLDKDWDSYVKGLDGLGLPRYMQILQDAYDKSSYKK